MAKFVTLAIFPIDSYSKAIGGGSGVIFSCQAQIKVFIARVSMLFTGCQNSTSFYGFNFWASILSHSINTLRLF